MTGRKGADGSGRLIRHLRMQRAVGIKSSCRTWPARQMRGRDRRNGTWWDRKLKCIVIEGKDFAQDTQEGGASQFELVLDSDEEGGAKGLLGDGDDEYVPETEPQDVPLSRIPRPRANQGRQRLGDQLHEWLRIIFDVENESAKVVMDSAKVQMDSVKLEKDSAKVEMESDKSYICAKVQMDTVKLEKESVKVEMGTSKEEVDPKASFSDIETDEETCWFQDGVDLRGHLQVEDDGFNDKGLLVIFIIRVRQLIFIKYDVNSICIHANIVYDIIQGFLVLPVDHLNQMEGQ